MKRFETLWSCLAVGIVLFASATANADLVVSEFAGTFGAIDVNASDLKQFTLDDGLITLTQGDNVNGMTIDPIVFDLTGYAGPLGTTNPVSVVGDAVTIRLASTTATYDVASAELTQLLNAPIAVGFVDVLLTLDCSDLATGGESVIVPSTLVGLFSINGLRVTVDEVQGQKNGKVQVGNVASASLTAIPEPTTCTLLGIGLMIGGLLLRRRG